MKPAEHCDRCGEPIAQRVALLRGASALHAVFTAIAFVFVVFPWRSERKFKPNYCKDCVGLYNLYFAGFLAGLAVFVFVLAVIMGSR